MIQKFKLKKKKKDKKKKGFTLVELLAVIVILAVIMVITIPTVIGSMSNAKEKSFQNAAYAIKKYVNNNYQNCKFSNELSLNYDNELFDENCELRNNYSDILIKNSGYELSDIKLVEVGIDEQGNYGVEINPSEDGVFKEQQSFATGDLNIIYSPDLSTGLIPVIYNGTNWEVADISKEWYSYTQEKQWWANAVSVNSEINLETGESNRKKYFKEDGSYNAGKVIEDNDLLAMFVWIPRFSYTIGCTSKKYNGELDNCFGYQIDGASDLATETPGAIDIKFSSKNKKYEYKGSKPAYYYDKNDPSSRNPDNWYTHPAFEFGGVQLTGLWVGKFETSVITTSDCYSKLLTDDESAKNICQSSNESVLPTILPNVVSLMYQNTYNQFETAKKFSTKNLYGLSGDTHLSKNSEWGAVAYLSQSKYGKYGNTKYEGIYKEIYTNNNSSGYTGVSSGNIATSSSKEIICQYNEDGINREKETGLCGPGASTTGNIYGIYDMSGNNYDSVMGYYHDGISEFGSMISYYGDQELSGFSKDNKPLNKYFDKYSYDDIYNSLSKEIIGHASYETTGWYNDRNDCLCDGSWTLRGGYSGLSSEAGIFHTISSDGKGRGNTSFHVTLVNENL